MIPAPAWFVHPSSPPPRAVRLALSALRRRLWRFARRGPGSVPARVTDAATLAELLTLIRHDINPADVEVRRFLSRRPRGAR
jgi:hypothetical protein